MGNIDRLLGRLEQFMKTAECQFADNKKDHQEIRRAIENLNAFKWKVVGMSIGASVATSVVFSLLRMPRAH